MVKTAHRAQANNLEIGGKQEMKSILTNLMSVGTMPGYEAQTWPTRMGRGGQR
jgi:hypothetical protein